MAIDNIPYRSGEEIRREKYENKLAHKNTWFLRGSTTSTLMVQPTERSLLAQKLRRALKGVTAPDGGTTSVLEKAGKSIMAGLTRADPGMKLGCQWRERTCPVVEKATCWLSRVVYEVKCSLCEAKYIGTTGLTMHARGLQHVEALLNSDTTYPLTKHYLQAHPGVVVDRGSISMAPLSGHQPDNVRRYIAEAVAISKATEKGATLLNSKGEWSRVKIKRLAITED